MEANLFCIRSGNVQKYINTGISLKISPRFVMNEGNMQKQEEERDRMCWGGPCLLLMAVTGSGGGRNRGGLSKTGRKEGSGRGGGSRFVGVKWEDNGGKGDGWKGKKGASRGWCGV